MKNITTCRACKKTFEYERNGSGAPPNYCSDECRKSRKKIKENITATCVECGKVFYYQPTVGRPKIFCSPECRKKNLINYRKKYFQSRKNEGTPVTVDEQINKLRKEPCLKCGARPSTPAQLIQHHDNIIENFIPLCETCYLDYYLRKWNVSDIEEKMKYQYPDQYWWYQIEKSELPDF